MGGNRGPEGGRRREQQTKALSDLEGKIARMKGVPDETFGSVERQIDSVTSQIDVLGSEEKAALKRVREQAQGMKGKKSFPEF
jgi:phage tail tape-measure protein